MCGAFSGFYELGVITQSTVDGIDQLGAKVFATLRTPSS
jgi:hypothetical protein